MNMDDDSFTFAVLPTLAAGGGRCIGVPLYPVFGQPRSPPRRRHPVLETATTRVPQGQLLVVGEGLPAQLGSDGDDSGLDEKPAETCYCAWCPGSPTSSSARCRKSGSTGSLLRWRPRNVGRCHSDGKEKFVFLEASSSGRKGRSGGGEGGHALSHYARGGGANGARRRTFLPYKQDLVGLFANTNAFRRSYHQF